MNLELFRIKNAIYYFAYIGANTVIGGWWKESEKTYKITHNSWSIERWQSVFDNAEKGEIEKLNVDDFKKEVNTIQKHVISSLFMGWITFY